MPWCRVCPFVPAGDGGPAVLDSNGGARVLYTSPGAQFKAALHAAVLWYSGGLFGCFVSPLLGSPFFFPFAFEFLCYGVLFRVYVTFCGRCVAFIAPSGQISQIALIGLLFSSSRY